MRYSYIHEKDFGGGHKVMSNIIWEGDWPMRKGEFPPEHPSHRFPREFQALRERGYQIVFLCHDGDRCSIEHKEPKSKKQFLKDIEECLTGWERV